MNKYTITLFVVLVIYWFILSGYFDHTVLLVSGAISVLIVVGLAARMKILDDETAPYLHVKSIWYFAWLFKEIIKANVAVVKAVLSPDMEISPSVFYVKMKHDTDLGRTVFANSVTLTPGTISVRMYGGQMMVHSLLEELTDIAGFQDMGIRAGKAMGDKMTFEHQDVKPSRATKKKLKK
ncbi:MAG: Na+/H+ antiporter subunit E [Robiginitomaculum sp.]|nr:Na+/H+ antiporter subunit E [Robiginitomaculum sp.]